MIHRMRMNPSGQVGGSGDDQGAKLQETDSISTCSLGPRSGLESYSVTRRDCNSDANANWRAVEGT